MCKKAFEKVSDIPVKDIAELVGKNSRKIMPGIHQKNFHRKIKSTPDLVMQVQG
jgi:hypothetical protein